MKLGIIMKHFALFFMLLVPMTMAAQKQYFLPTGDGSMDEKERPLIEVYLPQQELANGCAVVSCPGGAMRWLSWESDVANMAGIYDDEKQESRFCLNEDGTATWGMIGSLHFTEYTYTINGNTICLKPKDVESEDDCYEYDENTRTLKNEQGTVYYRQVVE